MTIKKRRVQGAIAIGLACLAAHPALAATSDSILDEKSLAAVHDSLKAKNGANAWTQRIRRVRTINPNDELQATTRAVSIQVLPFENHAKWHFLLKKFHFAPTFL